jgi:hypothetical protein
VLALWRRRQHARWHPLALQGALPVLRGWRLLFGYFTVAVVLSEKVRCTRPTIAAMASRPPQNFESPNSAR